jgi:hypothetical protein
MMLMLNQRNRLRTSCAPVVGRGDFKKLKTEDGAVQPITTATWFRFAPPKFLLHCVPQKTSYSRGTLSVRFWRGGKL